MIKTPCDSEDVRIAKNTRRGGASTSDCTQSCPGGPLRCDDTNDPIQGRHAAGRQVCVFAHTTPHHKQQPAVDRRDSLQLRHQLPSHSVFPTPAAVSDTRWRPSVRWNTSLSKVSNRTGRFRVPLLEVRRRFKDQPEERASVQGRRCGPYLTKTGAASGKDAMS